MSYIGKVNWSKTDCSWKYWATEDKLFVAFGHESSIVWKPFDDPYVRLQLEENRKYPLWSEPADHPSAPIWLGCDEGSLSSRSGSGTGSFATATTEGPSSFDYHTGQTPHDTYSARSSISQANNPLSTGSWNGSVNTLYPSSVSPASMSSNAVRIDPATQQRIQALKKSIPLEAAKSRVENDKLRRKEEERKFRERQDILIQEAAAKLRNQKEEEELRKSNKGSNPKTPRPKRRPQGTGGAGGVQ